jgi:hypothetical protein
LYSADELLAGLMPSQGTELCLVVEMMFSLSVGGSILGMQNPRSGLTSYQIFVFLFLDDLKHKQCIKVTMFLCLLNKSLFTIDWSKWLTTL